MFRLSIANGFLKCSNNKHFHHKVQLLCKLGEFIGKYLFGAITIDEQLSKEKIASASLITKKLRRQKYRRTITIRRNKT